MMINGMKVTPADTGMTVSIVMHTMQLKRIFQVHQRRRKNRRHVRNVGM